MPEDTTLPQGLDQKPITAFSILLTVPIIRQHTHGPPEICSLAI